MQMPNVIVHPPEEDDQLPFCCFDAANPAPAPADRHIQHPFQHPTPSPTRSVLDAYQALHHAHNNDNDHDHYDDDDFHFPDPHAPFATPPEEDSEVIEVVRVRKARSTPSAFPPNAPLTRTSSFKVKASKAFRSLTGSLRASKSQPPPVPPLPDSAGAPAPTLSRRGSLVLSQLFSSNASPSTSVTSQSSASSPDPDADPITSPTSSTFSVPPPEPVASPPSSRRSSLYTDTTPQDLAQLRSPSPTPTTASRRKFSRINLRKMFSFSSASISTASSGRTTPTHASSSGPQTPTSTESTDHPPNDITPRASRHATPSLASVDAPLTFDLADSDMSSYPSNSDVSFEMRLDSLHFDDLSFDAEKFITS